MNTPLTKIDPFQIAFDKNNPRGETEEQIEGSEEFAKLKLSVEKYGILEPLIVRPNNSEKKPYKLVDGERRLRAAIQTKQESVPAHIIKNEEVDARILAYHIHQLRKGWTKEMEVNAIKEIVKELLQKNKGMTESELNNKLQDITQHTYSEIKDILILLKYDEETMKKVQEGELAMSYLIQIDDSFISPLKRGFPEIVEKYGGDKNLRKLLVEKAQVGKLGGTRYLMDNVRKYFKDPTKEKKFKNAIIEFLEDPKEDITKVVENVEVKKSLFGGVESKNTIKKPESTIVPKPVDTKKGLIKIERRVINDKIFDLLFNYLSEAIREFEDRTEYKFENELELQKFLYAILKSLFVFVDFEDPTEKICKKSNRMDFVLKDHNIIIETKFVRDKNHAKKISDELSVDFLRYSKSPYGKKIINCIYDPNKHLGDHAYYRKGLNKLIPEAHHYIF